MRDFFSSVVLFLTLAFVFSNLTGCSGSVESVSQPTSEVGNPTNAGPIKKKTDYPPIATAVAEAEIKNLDGTTFRVADRKGKVVLLNMWATWCGPCRAEMPALVRMQDKHRDAGFEVVGLNTDDETLEQINEFVAEMKLNYTIAWADTNLQAALLNISKFGGIPQSFLIDRDGNLRGVFKGANKADIAKMEELVDMVVTGQETSRDMQPNNAEAGASQNKDETSLIDNKEKVGSDNKEKVGSKEKK